LFSTLWFIVITG